MTSAIPILPSIAPLGQTSEAWIVDIWGVMHNGARAYAAAGEACRRFRARGGIVVLLSNAPRPFSAVVPYMTELGVDPAAYDSGITSGDATREMVAEWQGRPLLHIGPQRDLGLFDGFDVRFAGPDAAEIAVCSGLYDDTKETPADYAELFDKLLARSVPMICANPDILVERGPQLIYCAGALAAAYEKKGGKVIYAGKPYNPIYDRTLREIARIKGHAVAKDNILCIGDGVETDLEGAHNAGLRSVFIASPIFLPDGLNPATLQALFAERPFAPVAALPALVW